MLQKIAKIITNNFGLKILAVVISVVFWLVIVNVEDPEKTLTFTVQVNIENADYLTNQGKTYEILNGSDTIKFTATAKRSIIEKMTDGDFEVTADMKDIVNMSEVPITITPTKYSNQITLTKKTMYVQLNVEDLVTKSFDLKVDTKGKISNGYTMSGLEVTPSKVTVSGPASVIESIERAAVEVDVSSIYSDFEKEAEIIFYDTKGKRIDASRLTLNRDTAIVSAGVLQTKTVPVEYEASGTPASGYQIGTVTGSITQVVIQGKKDALQDIESIKVSGTALNVSGKSETVEAAIDLTDYLPKGVSLIDEQENDSTVTIEIEGVSQATYDVPAENITFNNVASGYKASLQGAYVQVTLTGYPSALQALSASDIKGTADLTGLGEGTHVVEIKLSGNYETLETVHATVLIQSESEGGTLNNNDGTGQSSGNQ